MTCPRSDIVNPTQVGIYHCFTRCVRRAFLCGEDSVSGKSFEHRRVWIRGRLRTLVDIFAIEVVAYAVMSNHLHSLLRTRPDIAKEWSPEEVAIRWRTLFPRRRSKGRPAIPTEEEIQTITSQPKLVALYRLRLSNVSWFNRCLNENIARRANIEDEVTGRFWEGRFKCQRVFDIAGILACSVYVELNPVRAGMAKTIEQSDHTSIQDRIFMHAKEAASARHRAWPKIPLVSIADITEKTLTLPEYIKLVDQTGRLLVQGKASISPDMAPILERLNISSDHWLETAQNLGRMFKRVVGPAERIRHAASSAKKVCFHGIRSAEMVFASPD